MTRTNIEARVHKMIDEHFGTGVAITGDTNLVDHLGADSLDTVELVMATEEEFGICIHDCDLDKFKTVRDFINSVLRGGD